MKRLACDAIQAIWWLVTMPVYVIVRRAVGDELDKRQEDAGADQLTRAEEDIDVWEPGGTRCWPVSDCSMMRP